MQQQISISHDSIYDDGALYLSFGLSSSTLAKARKSGALRFSRKGKRIFYLGQWLLDWIQTDSEPCDVRYSQKPLSQAEAAK